jgi:quinoprotein glucose dehydrogenase
MQSNPIIVDGVLYATTPSMRVVALQATSGKELWSFDPNQGKPPGRRFRHRGVTVYKDRVFVTYKNFLYSLNKTTGQPIPSFGIEGRIDLRQGLDRPADGVTISASSPGVIFEDTIILGSTVPETLPGSPGHIRAFDVKTGQRRWIFHTIPHPGEFGYDTWSKESYQVNGGAKPLSIFTAPIGLETICSPIACWRSTPARAAGSGIFKGFATTCGIWTFRPRLASSQ